MNDDPIALLDDEPDMEVAERMGPALAAALQKHFTQALEREAPTLREAFAAAELGGFSEEDHPRGDGGRFVAATTAMKAAHPDPGPGKREWDMTPGLGNADRFKPGDEEYDPKLIAMEKERAAHVEKYIPHMLTSAVHRILNEKPPRVLPMPEQTPPTKRMTIYRKAVDEERAADHDLYLTKFHGYSRFKTSLEASHPDAAAAIEAAQDEAQRRYDLAHEIANAHRVANGKPAKEAELATVTDGQWITIGGSKGTDGKRHGGSPVYVVNGRITKGAAALHGKKIDALKEDEGAAPELTGTKRQQAGQKASRTRGERDTGRGYNRAVKAKEARKLGIKPEVLHQLTAEILAHDKAFKDADRYIVKFARNALAKHGQLQALHLTHAGGKQDASNIRGLDDVADELANNYPEHFHGGGHPSDKLYEMLTRGNPEPMSEEDAYEQAMEHLRGEHAKHRDTDVPFDAQFSTDTDDEDGESLAWFYASLWNEVEPTEEEIDAAADELEDSGWLVARTENGWEAQQDGTELSTDVELSLHSPVGGVSIGGTWYQGGRFIPGKAIENASPEDKERLAAAQKKADEAKASKAESRKARGSVDVGKLRERLKPHTSEPLSAMEKRSAKASFALLHRHHGELALHRVEELTDQVEKALAGIDDEHPNAEGLRTYFGRELAKLHAMTEHAQEKGVSGKVEASKPQKSAGHVAFIGNSELFKNAAGDLIRAPISDAVMPDGRRTGRWEAPAHTADERAKYLQEDAKPAAKEIASDTPEKPEEGSKKVDVLASIPHGGESFVDGHRVSRLPDGRYRLDTEKGAIVGSAKEVQDRIARNIADQKVDQKRIDAALQRHADKPRAQLLTPAFEAENEAYSALPDKTRVAIADGNYKGRIGEVVREEDGSPRVKLDGTGERVNVQPSDVEPLDPKQSWRIEQPKVAKPKQASMFDAPTKSEESSKRELTPAAVSGTNTPVVTKPEPEKTKMEVKQTHEMLVPITHEMTSTDVGDQEGVRVGKRDTTKRYLDGQNVGSGVVIGSPVKRGKNMVYQVRPRTESENLLHMVNGINAEIVSKGDYASPEEIRTAHAKIDSLRKEAESARRREDPAYRAKAEAKEKEESEKSVFLASNNGLLFPADTKRTSNQERAVAMDTLNDVSEEVTKHVQWKTSWDAAYEAIDAAKTRSETHQAVAAWRSKVAEMAGTKSPETTKPEPEAKSSSAK